MKIIKMIPFYLFLAFNFLLALLFILNYLKNIIGDPISWSNGELGWAYDNRFNYTLIILFNLLVVIVPSVYALLKLKSSKKWAYFFASIPFILYLYGFIYNYFFPLNI